MFPAGGEEEGPVCGGLPWPVGRGRDELGESVFLQVSEIRSVQEAAQCAQAGVGDQVLTGGSVRGAGQVRVDWFTKKVTLEFGKIGA